MIEHRCRPVLALLAGLWPTPALTVEESVAWVAYLCDPVLAVSEDEAMAIIKAEAAREFRPRPGQLEGLVHAYRRHQVFAGTVPALRAAGSDSVSPDRASQWIAACRRVLAGERLEDARKHEGLVTTP